MTALTTLRGQSWSAHQDRHRTLCVRSSLSQHTSGRHIESAVMSAKVDLVGCTVVERLMQTLPIVKVEVRSQLCTCLASLVNCAPWSVLKISGGPKRASASSSGATQNSGMSDPTTTRKVADGVGSDEGNGWVARNAKVRSSASRNRAASSGSAVASTERARCWCVPVTIQGMGRGGPGAANSSKRPC